MAQAVSTLKARDITRFRKRLLQTREDLHSALGRPPEQDAELVERWIPAETGADFADHPGEDSEVTFEQEMDLSIRQNARELLDQVDEALQQIRSGHYGICAGCKRPIPKERLEALPSATYCVPCQAAREELGR